MTGRGRFGRGRLPPRQDAPQPGAQPPQAQPPQAQPPQAQPPQAQPPQAQPAPQPQAQAPATQPPTQGRGRGRGRGWAAAQAQAAPKAAPAGIQPAPGRQSWQLGVPRHMQQQPVPQAQPQQPAPQQMAPPQYAAPPQQMSPPQQMQPPQASGGLQAVQPRSGVGRAAFRGGAAAAGDAPEQTGQVTAQMSKMSIKAAQKREHFRIIRTLRYLDYDDVQHRAPISKIGIKGEKIRLITNYFQFEKFPEYHLNQYHVDFDPPIDKREERIRLLEQHAKFLGRDRAFDGMILFTPTRLENVPVTKHSKRDSNEDIVAITIRSTGEVPVTSPTFIQVVNIQMRKALAMLKFRQFGHHYFDPEKPVDIPSHKMTVIPGFITAVKFHEHGLLLGVDTAHKVLRYETALDVLENVRRTSRGSREDMQEDIRKKLLGSTVLTRYNNHTYRIDDIDFESTPEDTFLRNGEKISYIKYYKEHYNVPIYNRRQPMLVSRPKARDIRGGRTDMLYLVPELCGMTGLTDEQRSNRQLMRSMSDQTRLTPEGRVSRLTNFRERLCKNERTFGLLRSWEIVPTPDLLETDGRIIDRQPLYMSVPSMGKQQKQQKLIEFSKTRPEWTHLMRNSHMTLAVDLNNWIVVYAEKNRSSALEIVRILINDAPGLGMNIAEPRQIILERDSPDSFKHNIARAINKDVQMVMAVVPNLLKNRYDAIKKVCCLEVPCPSQVVHANLKSHVLRSACTKIAIQMNCKMGGVPWISSIPLTDTMFIGIDTYHDSTQRNKSAVGFVATLDRNCTRFFVDCSIQGMSGEELANTLAPLMSVAVSKFMDVNQGNRPQRFIFYRDGVGDGMLRMVDEYEKKQIVDAIMTIYQGVEVEKRPVVYFFVVKKRILTRLFTKELKNPPPGTVVDRDITTEFWFDFFLISQSVGQGTVNPVHYNCIEMPKVKELCLSADQLQTLTYRLCHLYYNWAGTIRVPMVCMYAHKVAFLVGQSLHEPPSAELCNRLFFL